MLSFIPVLGVFDPMSLVRALPGDVSQGLIWGIMSIGVYITFKILNFADLTVDGTMATGGAVAVMAILAGYPPVVAVALAFLAGMMAGFITGVLHWNSGYPCRNIDTDRSVFGKPEYNRRQGESGSQCRPV